MLKESVGGIVAGWVLTFCLMTVVQHRCDAQAGLCMALNDAVLPATSTSFASGPELVSWFDTDVAFGVTSAMSITHLSLFYTAGDPIGWASVDILGPVGSGLSVIAGTGMTVHLGGPGWNTYQLGPVTLTPNTTYHVRIARAPYVGQQAAWLAVNPTGNNPLPVVAGWIAPPFANCPGVPPCTATMPIPIRLVGSGCPGTIGSAQVVGSACPGGSQGSFITIVNRPIIGAPFSLQVTPLGGSGGTFLLFLAGGVGSGFALPGTPCTIWLDPLTMQSLAGGGLSPIIMGQGGGILTWQIANDPTLAGISVAFQGIYLTPIQVPNQYQTPLLPGQYVNITQAAVVTVGY